jgi:hypothetical protein
MVLPNLIICGAPKCGTSSLYFWLRAHPEACASKVKETFYFADEINRFNQNLNCFEHSLTHYSHQWDHCQGQKIIFEATAPYIYFENALQRIRELPIRPKLLFILREPASRLYSKFKFNKYKLKNFQGSFEEYVSLNGTFGSGRHFEEGLYINYLHPWMEVYGRENMGIFIFEEMLADRVGFMMKVAEFLDIEPGFYRDFDFFQRNETVAIKSVGLHRVGLWLQPYVPAKVQELLIPFYMKLNSSKARDKNNLEKEQLAILKDLYASSNRELKQEFEELNLPGWRI